MTGQRWLVLLTSFAVLAVAFALSLYCWPAIYRPLTVRYGWNFAGANAGGAIVLFLSGVLSPLVGALIDKFKPKRVMLSGIFIMAVALALLSTIHSLGEYYVYCFLLGIGASAVSILPASILIAPYFPRTRGRAIGFINAGIGVGGFVAPRLATAQIASRGISGTFLVLSACMAIPFLLTLFVLRTEGIGRGPGISDRTTSARELVRLPMFWIYGIAILLSSHAMYGVQQNLISYLTGAHVSAQEAALIAAISIAAAAPGKFIGGIIADKVSARAAMIFSVACVALGVLSLLNTAPRSFGNYWLGVIFGIGYGGIFNAAPTIAFEYFGTRQVSKAQGLFRVFLGLGTATGGEMAGFLFDESHRWSVPFTVDMVIACAGLALLLFSARYTRASPVVAKDRICVNVLS